VKTEQLNGWLTLLANFGVILGLVFLGVEINQSNRATEASTYQARISEIEASYQNAALSDYLPGIYDKFEKEGLESISDIELRRLQDWEMARIYRIQGQYYQYQQGYLDERSFRDVIGGGRLFLPRWEALSLDLGALDPDFLDIIRE
jgi:hypothetical protein